MIKTLVYLIGAGSGDPELITQKASRVLASADIVLYDYLVHPNIILLASNAKKICVGKKKGAHSTKQSNINKLLIDYAKAGKVVARLKGGDPMIFGRCGEEMSALQNEGIPYEIIPGITSAIAVPTYAGIPITHRDFSHSVAFVTATRANDIQNIDFPNADTLVIMMSLLRLPALVKRLIEIRSKSTPIAIIESGTYSNEKIITGTLDTIEAQQQQFQLAPPALIVVGDVVTLRERFRWRGHLPFSNKRFVIFRPDHQQSNLRNALSEAGAEVLSLSLNQIVHKASCLEHVPLTKLSYIIFTSENGVRSFFTALKTIGDSRMLSGKKIVSIGQHTTKTLGEYNIIPDLTPKDATSQGILALLNQKLTANDGVLIPTSSEASDELMELSETGALIHKVVAYDNQLPDDIDQRLDWIQPDDYFIFMNSVSVSRLAKLYKNSHHHMAFSIGPKTTKTLINYGISNIVESDFPEIDALIKKIMSTFQK